MAVILDAEIGKTSMRAGMMGNHHNEYVFEVELLAVVLCVAGTLTTAAFDRAGRLYCRSRMARHWISEGAFAWSHRKFSLVQTLVCRMKRGGTSAVVPAGILWERRLLSP